MSIVHAISRPGVRRSRPAAAEDAKLIGRVRAGDERAFEAIFKRHHAPLLSYARHMLANRDEAEDALQQAFIKAHRALLGGTVPRELRPWLYAIVRNCCLSAIAARRRTVELDERTANLTGLAEAVYEREDLRELLADIGGLPEDQRSALLLAELDDLSHEAIATIVDCPVSKVKALVYQARSTLIADRDARNASCRDIREELATARGGQLRRGPLRRHLSLCVGCSDFQRALATQRRSLAVALPVLPSAGLAAKILSHSALQAASAAGQAGGAIGSAAAPVGTAAAPAGSAAAPLATVTAPAGAAAGGGAGVGAAASTATGAGAAASGGGTGAVVGSGVLAKVAVGGAVAALATAGAVTSVRHLVHPHRRHSTHAHVERAHRAHLTPGANAQTQLLAASRTLSGVGSTATSSGAPSLETTPAATSDAALASPLSQSSPQGPQPPPLASALPLPPATSATTTPSGTQTPSGHGAQPQSGPSPAVIRDRRRARQQLRLRRLSRQAERRQLRVQRRRLAREERLRKARELKQAREQRKRLREERERKARELKEAKEQRERLCAERERKAQELKEARERRELEAQRKREQREAAAATPKPSTQTTQSSTPVPTTTTTATEAPSTAASGTEGKRKRKKS